MQRHEEVTTAYNRMQQHTTLFTGCSSKGSDQHNLQCGPRIGSAGCWWLAGPLLCPGKGRPHTLSSTAAGPWLLQTAAPQRLHSHVTWEPQQWHGGWLEHDAGAEQDHCSVQKCRAGRFEPGGTKILE